MDWKYLGTTAIAVISALISWKAFHDARIARKNSDDTHKRIEVYDYYPIVSIELRPDKTKVCAVLTNSSNKNMAPKFTITFNVFITTDASYSAQKDNVKVSGNNLAPNEVRTIYAKEIDDVINNSIPFLKQHAGGKSTFVVRAVVEFSAPHPSSESGHEHTTARFRYDPQVHELVAA